MSKFGRFVQFNELPQEEYEGEYMVHTGDYVQILGKNKAPNGENELLAVVSVLKGESVRKIA
ncbi:MAG: hypothetical protein WAK89_12340 [Candidatus Sulfotelmatobacter sp.]